MPKSFSERARYVAALLTALVCSTAWAVVDVIDRPSISSKRADHSLLLAVTRAGHRLVVAGERGIVLLSDNNGESWRQAMVPVSVTLTSVHFLNERDGWITGHSGILLHTADAGETWSKTLDGSQIAQTVLNAELERAAGPGQLAEARRLVADGPDKPLLDVCFLSQQRGFIIGAYGVFLRTEDGGATWLPWQTRLQNLNGRHLTRVASIDGELYVVGEQGAAYLSRDNGNTFAELQSPYRGTFFGVASVGPDSVVIYGLRGNAFRVDRHGTEWKRLATPTAATYSASARLASGRTVIASQTGDLLRIADSGTALVPIQVPTRTLTAAIAVATDGTLIVAGRGIFRFPANVDGGSR